MMKKYHSETTNDEPDNQVNLPSVADEASEARSDGSIRRRFGGLERRSQAGCTSSYGTKTAILPSVYAVLWRQCPSKMKELLKSTDVFQAIDETNDVIALLRLIRHQLP
jgi:hypothetical protein